MDLELLKDTPPWDWPRDAAGRLLEVLRDAGRELAERLLAAELAGDCCAVNDEIAEALLAILGRNDEEDELRCRAAISLGPALEYGDTMGFDDPEDQLLSEAAFRRLRESLHELHLNPEVPREVRRSILEAAVRAPQDWHAEAIRAAHGSDDDRLRLTAVFCMRFVRGFDDQIVEALGSEAPELRLQAVLAAAAWQVDAAWSQVAEIVAEERADKDLLLAAIEAVASIRPVEAAELLLPLSDSVDEDVAETVLEAIAIADGLDGDQGDLDERDDDLVH